MTLVAAAVILTFTSMEFFDYRRINMDTSLIVDRSRGERLTVSMNVTFPRVPCYRESYVDDYNSSEAHVRIVLSLDVMDISGETQRDISHNIVKTRLSETGARVSSSRTNDLQNEVDKMNSEKPADYCGSCYGGTPTGDSPCCNTCDSVREAYVNRGWSFSNPDGIEQVMHGQFLSRPTKLNYFAVCQRGLV